MVNFLTKDLNFNFNFFIKTSIEQKQYFYVYSSVASFPSFLYDEIIVKLTFVD